MKPHLVGAAALALVASAGWAQPYPIKPVRIVTSEFGSGTDLVMRLIAPGVGAALGRQIVVENRGFMANEAVARANADGYTLLCYGSPMWHASLLRSVPYDPFRSFEPITLAVDTPNVLVVHPALPVKNVKELIALAKAKPGELNYAAGSIGASTHLAGELFKHMAGVDIVRIAYKGTGPGLNALIGAEVQLMFPNAGAAAQHIRSGRVRALAVASAQPSPLMPELPTLSASGLPGYQSSSPIAVFAPAGTPRAITRRLNAEMVKVLNRADVKDKLFNSGIEVIASTPEALTAAMRADMARMDKVIKAAGIREQ